MSSIPPLVHIVTDDEVKSQAKELFEQMKRKSGSVPKWMRVMANCEDILIGFFTLFKATMDDAPLPSELKWKIAFKVSELNKCEFCVSVSEMQLKTFGMDQATAEKIDSSLSEKEKLAMDFAIAANDHAYNIDSKLIEKVKAVYSDEQIVELTAVVGLFNYINRFNDSLGVLPDTE